MGKCMDSGMKSVSFIIPAACFGYLLLLSMRGGKKPATGTKGQPQAAAKA